VAAKQGAGNGSTQPFDHFAMRARDMVAMRQELKDRGLEFDERVVPGGALAQIFLDDPDGVRVELTFDVAAETEAGTF
jgi:hypothetical protein